MTDGMVFTNRFGLTPTKVLFGRICRDNGINHLLTALATRPETAKSSAFTERFAGVPHREGFPLARRSATRTRRQNRGLQHPATESHLRRDPRDASTEGVQIQGLLVQNRNGSFQNALLDQAHNRIQDRANGPSRRDRHLDPQFATDLPHRVSLLGPARKS